RAALDHVHDELVVQIAGPDLATGADDRIRDLRVEEAELAVRESGRFLDGRERVDQIRVLLDRDAGDREVLDGPQRLDPVVIAVRDVPLAEQVLRTAQLAGEIGLLASGQAIVRGAQPARDDLCRAYGEAGVELRAFARDLLDLLARDLDDLRGLLDAGRCRMGVVIEEAPLPDRVAGVQDVERLGAAADALLDRDLAPAHDPELASRLALVEDVGAGQVAHHAAP